MSTIHALFDDISMLAMTTPKKKNAATHPARVTPLLRSANRKQGRPADSEEGLGPLAAGRGKDAVATDDEIYDRIHEAVLDQRLPPGTKLKEVALAELFGVTRATIRKVLARLAHSRLVDLRPNRGAAVASPSVEESRDLFSARRAIEGAIIDRLARNITREQLRELRAMVKQEQEAYRRGEVRQGLKLSIEFHRVLADMAGNSVLAEFLEQLVSRTPLVVLTYKGPNQAASCSNDEHSVVLDAIAAGDADKAVAAMKDHLRSLEGQLNFKDAEQSTDLAEIFGVQR